MHVVAMSDERCAHTKTLNSKTLKPDGLLSIGLSIVLQPTLKDLLGGALADMRKLHGP